jgi:hypothetical protein
VTPAKQPPIAYTNRRGDTYYLHAGTTKTGKPRYFVAKTIGAGALAAMPDGFELVESINAVVSVRRIDPNVPTIAPGDLAAVRSELDRHPHLRFHRADVVKDAIVVFEPVGGVSAAFLDDANRRELGFFVDPFARRVALDERTRFTPVMKFVRGADGYDVHRMTYRGDSGWSWPIASGRRIAPLAARYLRHIGTPKFFELD